MDNTYNDSHRLFIQSMFSKRIITEDDALKLYDQVCELTGLPATEDYPLFISSLNEELAELDYSLRISHDERDGIAYLTLVNVKQDPVTELATTFTPIEISYIRELFEKIITADNENFALSTRAAINLGHSVESRLTLKDTQDILDRLVQDRWIAMEEKGVYYLDTRAIAELQSYFREQYSDIVKECTTCLDFITMGERCEVEECPVRLHKYCADKLFANKNNPCCPQCSTRWNRSNTFGLGLPDDTTDFSDD
ncbi:Nse1 non-SMC component of SMC5-6 complex-domain-containing protein [Cokeromyces recurvatus]|uniref:Nse1 non-SMC component of SMC5-6 complex-domain-containing protein n=1 Tax=Cokeromyces recurvatus TaxID=90255 RepID=UPI0022202547|nr:Nse1 non-SMC component of SMC5-6 complex-domain-containing protein [Cokeromyces recurvatus]KAI7897821.1 Nse1 non-SMC component of SMC5-6 complex-domain-containing protein [Cokeromyces recurvatus]